MSQHSPCISNFVLEKSKSSLEESSPMKAVAAAAAIYVS